MVVNGSTAAARPGGHDHHHQRRRAWPPPARTPCPTASTPSGRFPPTTPCSRPFTEEISVTINAGRADAGVRSRKRGSPGRHRPGKAGFSETGTTPQGNSSFAGIDPLRSSTVQRQPRGGGRPDLRYVGDVVMTITTDESGPPARAATSCPTVPTRSGSPRLMNPCCLPGPRKRSLCGRTATLWQLPP